MPKQHSIWRAGKRTQALPETQIPNEALLEKMIVSARQMLSPEWIIIGPEEETSHGGRIDLLTLAPDRMDNA